jgi:enamine deaminase RidA (YjgF/YER057c/UK114 family)
MANSPIPSVLANIGGASAASQTVWPLDIFEGALKGLESSMSDVVRTRALIKDVELAEQVSIEHGWKTRCAGILPSNTMVTAGIVGEEMLVEIEPWGEVGSGEKGIVTVEKV